MPVISMFYGIIVRMYKESNLQHNLPHIHAEYNNQFVVVDLDGNVLEGELPVKKLRMLLTWMDIHQEELYANWNTLNKDGEYFKIDPLR
ncbi:MAG: DUF4160 domain-containing protein [Bacillota bacterium]|jgi:hypothetical protein|nr:DUF4160 domain-containing protein [Bacillota bacterium]